VEREKRKERRKEGGQGRKGAFETPFLPRCVPCVDRNLGEKVHACMPVSLYCSVHIVYLSAWRYSQSKLEARASSLPLFNPVFLSSLPSYLDGST